MPNSGAERLKLALGAGEWSVSGLAALSAQFSGTDWAGLATEPL
jgi:hypothetical protein